MNDDPIGRVIRTPQRNAYLVEHFQKVACNVGREYIIRVGPYIEPEPHTNGGPSVDSSSELFSLTFYVRFEESYIPDAYIYRGVGDVADTNMILAMLRDSLDESPEGILPKNPQGQYELNFP